LAAEAVRYVAARRALGFSLARDEKLLAQFCGWLEKNGKTDRFHAQDAVAWAVLPGGAGSWHAGRLTVVRKFAEYLVARGWDVQVPPPGALPGGGSARRTPFIYTAADVQALMDACGAVFRPALRQETMRTLVGLLAVTGARIGEVIALDVADYDPAAQSLRIATSKSGGGRVLPLHPTTCQALDAYLGRCAELTGRPRRGGDPLFLSAAGTRPLYCNVQHGFKRLAAAAGLEPRGDAKPTLHSLRHSLATRAIARAYELGQDPARALTVLSAWLGHTDPAHTYWYLDTSSGLLDHAVRLLERPQPGLSTPLVPAKTRRRPWL
jgi:integrase